MKTPALLLLASVLSLAARAEPAMVAQAPAEVSPRHWGVGVQFGPLGVPAGHLGVPHKPIGLSQHLSVELTLRRRLGEHMALNAGLGLPHAALGFSGWIGYELFVRVAQGRRCALEVYGDPGLQLGAAGPDYFARHGGDFVDYWYGLAPPLAFSLRTPLGLRVVWPRARLDLYGEAGSIVALTPAVEPFFQVTLGVRVRL